MAEAEPVLATAGSWRLVAGGWTGVEGHGAFRCRAGRETRICGAISGRGCPGSSGGAFEALAPADRAPAPAARRRCGEAPGVWMPSRARNADLRGDLRQGVSRVVRGGVFRFGADFTVERPVNAAPAARGRGRRKPQPVAGRRWPGRRNPEPGTRSPWPVAGRRKPTASGPRPGAAKRPITTCPPAAYHLPLARLPLASGQVTITTCPPAEGRRVALTRAGASGGWRLEAGG